MPICIGFFRLIRHFSQIVIDRKFMTQQKSTIIIIAMSRWQQKRQSSIHEWTETSVLATLRASIFMSSLVLFQRSPCDVSCSFQLTHIYSISRCFVACRLNGWMVACPIEVHRYNCALVYITWHDYDLRFTNNHTHITITHICSIWYKIKI